MAITKTQHEAVDLLERVADLFGIHGVIECALKSLQTTLDEAEQRSTEDGGKDTYDAKLSLYSELEALLDKSVDW